ncbi:MAG: general stress protein [Ramlibacter sp.]|nr:general stress protein [Ramlibacter sp.]
MASYPTRSSPAPGGARPIGSSNRGFASVDPERQREVANPGGKAANQSSNANADSVSGNANADPVSGDGGGSRNGNDQASGSR